MIKILNLKYTKSNSIQGAIIYGSGDLIATLILGEFSIFRLLGMIAVGATFYALEIPNYFNWIEGKTRGLSGMNKTMAKTGMAILYFNPIWIARHLLFIRFFSGSFVKIELNLLEIAWLSFLVNIPLSLVANYLIQNIVRFNWRFFASSIFSALMAIYYALSEVVFN